MIQNTLLTLLFAALAFPTLGLAGGVNPKAKPLGCERPMGWHTSPDSGDFPSELVSFDDFVGKFSRVLLQASRKPRNKAGKYELEKLNSDLRRYARNLVQVNGILYPKTESVLGADSLMAMNFSGCKDRVKDPASLREINEKLAEFSLRSKKIFRPNLVARALRDWQIIAEQSPGLRDQRGLLKNLAQLNSEIRISLSQKTRPSIGELRQWKRLMTQAISMSEFLRRPRVATFYDSDHDEAMAGAESDAAYYTPNDLRGMMKEGFYLTRLKMIKAHREENDFLFGSSLSSKSALLQLQILGLELLKNYSNDSER